MRECVFIAEVWWEELGEKDGLPDMEGEPSGCGMLLLVLDIWTVDGLAVVAVAGVVEAAC